MSDYWARRKAQEMFEYMAGAEETADEISELYLKASRYLSNELDQIFERFRKKHNLSESEARRLLNQMHDRASLDELKSLLREESGNQAELLAELESPAYQARMERLQQLQNQIDLTMQQVYKQEKTRNTSWYLDFAGEAYYHSIFDIQQQTGLAFGFSLVSADDIDRVINSRWSGENYSSRIWRNTNTLAQTLKEELLLSLVTGRTDRETAEVISNKFASGASVARRLVRTESNYLAGEMSAIAYQDCGIEYYIYLAILDLKTCKEDCAPLDGKRFKVSEREPGRNYHPMHPWCRCTEIADISAEELARLERAARDPVTGKTMKVPANMTYQQWYEKYVRGNPEAELNEKKIRNRASDRKQYEKYKIMLEEENVPDSLDEFQKVKYSGNDEYDILKVQMKGMAYYNKAVSNEPDITKQVTGVAKRAGMETVGLQHRIKTKESYLNKIRRKYSPEGNRYEVRDILRYTYTAPANELVERMLKSIELYQAAGYNTIKVTNYWMNKRNPYNGINTTLRAPNGQIFELQYHTPESYAAKDSMHRDYEKWRSLDATSYEAITLRKKMFVQSAGMEIPTDISEVGKNG